MPKQRASPPLVAIDSPARAEQSSAPERGENEMKMIGWALQGGGYAASLGTDKVGDPMVTSGVGGTTFQVFFYNCTDHRECATVTFHSGYDLNNTVTLEQINAWNRGKRFGRAYLDSENDPILEMDIDLDDGGISPLLFIDNIEFWASVLGEFERHIGYRQ
jgi:hypothetical protein